MESEDLFEAVPRIALKGIEAYKKAALIISKACLGKSRPEEDETVLEQCRTAISDWEHADIGEDECKAFQEAFMAQAPPLGRVTEAGDPLMFDVV